MQNLQDQNGQRGDDHCISMDSNYISSDQPDTDHKNEQAHNYNQDYPCIEPFGSSYFVSQCQFKSFRM